MRPAGELRQIAVAERRRTGPGLGELRDGAVARGLAVEADFHRFAIRASRPPAGSRPAAPRAWPRRRHRCRDLRTESPFSGCRRRRGCSEATRSPVPGSRRRCRSTRRADSHRGRARLVRAGSGRRSCCRRSLLARSRRPGGRSSVRRWSRASRRCHPARSAAQPPRPRYQRPAPGTAGRSRRIPRSTRSAAAESSASCSCCQRGSCRTSPFRVSRRAARSRSRCRRNRRRSGRPRSRSRRASPAARPAPAPSRMRRSPRRPGRRAVDRRSSVERTGLECGFDLAVSIVGRLSSRGRSGTA